jgi:hypothetical protein
MPRICAHRFENPRPERAPSGDDGVLRHAAERPRANRIVARRDAASIGA